MRAIISKVLTGSLVAGAALAVSACGPKTETTTTTDNTMVTDMNTTGDAMGSMTNDTMTTTESTTNTGMMAGNDAMMNSSMTTTNTTTTNAM